MLFLNPYMLLTLGIIPILLIIHTLKPKPRQVDVTNLFLWNEVLKEKNRNLSFERLKRNLPLLLQILIVVLAALALAKPTWTYQTAKKGNMILVIDTSASMKTRSGSGIRFDSARQKALQLIEKRDPGQKILIVEAGKKSVVKTGLIDDTSQALDLAKKLQPSDAAADLESAIYLALSFVDPAKEDLLYLITDGAGKDFSALIKNQPKIRPIIISGGEHNVGITKFEFRQQVDHSDNYEFMLEIKNFNLSPVECSTRLSVDGGGLFESVIPFDAQEKKMLIIPYSGLINGIARATLEIDDDFAVDNQVYLSLNAAKEIWVLLVSKGNPFLEKLLAAYPNFRVNSVKEIIPSSWPEQTARHDIVIVDRMDFPETERGNFLLIDAYSPAIPVIKTGQVRLPEILAWDRKSPLLANLNLSGLIVEEGAKLQADKQLQPLIESARTGLMYALEENGLRVVLIGFDFTRSDLPFKVAFPVMMSNIFNWLNPHKLEFSILQTQAGEAFDIYLNPQTDTLYTRAPYEKWEKHRVKMNPFRYQNTGRVGIYTIAENGKERYFTVNLADESESDINSISLEHRPDQSEPPLVSAEISAQQPLWMFFIIIGCTLLMIEWYSWLKLR
ncbi:MAG: VWA domain-containing protein [Deltaproteobacteria bacterium]|nr:VWA domain-containing protein [Deltaproteobacteria bacterium]